METNEGELQVCEHGKQHGQIHESWLYVQMCPHSSWSDFQSHLNDVIDATVCNFAVF